MLERTQTEVARDQNFWGDLGRLENFKKDKDSPEALEKVAQEFEAIFVQMAIKSMRDAEQVMQSELSTGQSEQMWKELYDQQLAVSIANSGGLGLSKTIVENMTPSLRRDPLKLMKEPMPFDFKDQMKPELSLLKKLNQRQAQGQPTVMNLPKKPGVQATTQNSANQKMAQNNNQSNYNLPESFVEAIWPHAKVAGQKLGIDPKVLISQAALETGWGKKMMSVDGQASHNLFGIKADQRWDGKVAVSKTTEYDKAGVLSRQTAKFRAYDNMAESMQDYVNFLQQNPRYQQALQKSDDPKEFVNALQKAGYATDPKYADKIMRVYHSDIMSNGLKLVKNSAEMPTHRVTT